LFSPLALLLVKLSLSLEFRDPLFSRAKLMRKLLRDVERMLAICFGDSSGLVQQLQYSLPGSIKLINAV
jgi:hypothetical protein